MVAEQVLLTSVPEVYAVPDDDGATFERLIEGLSEHLFREMVEQPCAGWVLLAQPRDTTALLVVVSDKDLTLLVDAYLHVPTMRAGTASPQCL